jgi:hypothetical protein
VLYYTVEWEGATEGLQSSGNLSRVTNTYTINDVLPGDEYRVYSHHLAEMKVKTSLRPQ